MVSSQRKEVGLEQKMLPNEEGMDHTAQPERRAQMRAQSDVSEYMVYWTRKTGWSCFGKGNEVERKVQCAWERLCMLSEGREDYVTLTSPFIEKLSSSASDLANSVFYHRSIRSKLPKKPVSKDTQGQKDIS
jgi:hypothetical protein